MAKTKQNKTKIIQRCFLVLEDNKTLEANQFVDYKYFLTVDVMYQNEQFTVVQRSVLVSNAGEKMGNFIILIYKKNNFIYNYL